MLALAVTIVLGLLASPVLAADFVWYDVVENSRAGVVGMAKVRLADGSIVTVWYVDRDRSQTFTPGDLRLRMSTDQPSTQRVRAPRRETTTGSLDRSRLQREISLKRQSRIGR